MVIPHLFGSPAVHPNWGNWVYAVQYWSPSPIQGRGVNGKRTGGHGAISWGNWSHLSLQQLEDNVDVSRHSSFQPGGERDRK